MEQFINEFDDLEDIVTLAADIDVDDLVVAIDPLPPPRPSPILQTDVFFPRGPVLVYNDVIPLPSPLTIEEQTWPTKLRLHVLMTMR